MIKIKKYLPSNNLKGDIKMLTVLDVLLFTSLVAVLVMLLMQKHDSTKRFWKVQAYITICALALELISFIVRLILAESWFILLIILILHAIIGSVTIIEAKENGAFEKKSKQNVNIDVVV